MLRHQDCQPGDPDMQSVHERLQWARQAAGYESASDAARAIGVKPSTYIHHENGTRTLARAAQKYAQAFGVRLDWLLRGRGPAKDQEPARELPTPSSSALVANVPIPFAAPIRIVGRVAAGVFREVAQLELEACPAAVFPPDPRYPHASQYDLVVEGNSINRFAQDGELLRVVDIASADVSPVDGDLVIVRRTDGGIVETTAKRVRRVNGRWELWYDSTDPRYQGVVTIPNGGDEVAIVGLVLYAYRPARPGAAYPF